MLDCRSLQYQLLPVPKDARLVICNSMVKHENSAGEYNTRRAQCEEGVRLLSAKLPGIRALRDVSVKDFEQHKENLPLTIQKRCRHVITENQRVLDAGSALRRDDLASFGTLMFQSHASLRDDYAVSCPELDLLVETARSMQGIYGARMTGGGFGGCTVNLVAVEAVAEFQQKLAAAYQSQTGTTPEIYVSTASEGVGRVQVAG